jgi:hypothetical protein
LAARKAHLVNSCVVAVIVPMVIDTVGVKTDRPLAMLDMYGTPYTRALHVVERYRLLDYEAAREGLERDAKESPVIPNTSMQRHPAYRGKYLKLLFTVEDQGGFNVPWFACAEGTENAHYLKARIRRGTWRSSEAYCRPTPSPASTPCTRTAASAKPRAGPKG